VTIRIRVFGPSPGCAKCKAAEKTAIEVAQKFDNVIVEKHDVFSEEAQHYNIMMTPTVMANDLIVEVGKPPTSEKLTQVIRKIIRKQQEESS
jgi:thiol-disulfide isomerase/thioredoxin